MSPFEIAQIKEIAFKLAYEVNPTSKVEDVIAEAEKVFIWLRSL